MTRALTKPLSQVPLLNLPRRRFTADEYFALGRAGIIGEDDRLELLHGEIVFMTPIGPDHCGEVIILTNEWALLAPHQTQISVQNPLPLSDDSVPQPDLILLKPRKDRYRGRYPRPADVLLLVEVADSSAAKDRGVKLPLYAAAGIKEVWIVDVAEKIVEAFSKPSRGMYRQQRKLQRGGTLAPLAFPKHGISWQRLFG